MTLSTSRGETYVLLFLWYTCNHVHVDPLDVKPARPDGRSRQLHVIMSGLDGIGLTDRSGLDVCRETVHPASPHILKGLIRKKL